MTLGKPIGTSSRNCEESSRDLESDREHAVEMRWEGIGPCSQTPSTRALFGADFAGGSGALTELPWISADAGRGLLLAVSIALELGTATARSCSRTRSGASSTRSADREAAAFFRDRLFLGVVLGFVLVSTYRIYVRRALEIRWRSWLTDHFLAALDQPAACCQMELLTAAADNPDQRIAEDVRNYVASALGLSLSLLAAVVTLVSFAGLLWTLSGTGRSGSARRSSASPAS